MNINQFNELFKLKGVKRKTISKILDNSRILDYKENEIIYFENEDHPYYYFIIEGFVAIYKIFLEGDERYLFINNSGRRFNEFVIDGRKTTTSAKAHTKAKVLRVEKDLILELMEEDFDFNLEIVNSISRIARRMQRQMANVGSYNTKKRIAARLWKLSRDHGVRKSDFTEIRIPLSQSDFSNLVGTSRETVNRTLRELEDEGYICLDGKYIMVRKDKDLLDYINN